MKGISADDWRRAKALADLGMCNPFGSDRIDLERQVLGDAFIDTGYAWHKDPGNIEQRSNIRFLTQGAEELAEIMRKSLRAGEGINDEEAEIYDGLVLYLLYNRYERVIFEHILRAEAGQGDAQSLPIYGEFAEDVKLFYAIPGLHFEWTEDPAHLFAGFFQLRCAFHHIYEYIIGGSIASAHLRMSVWQSIFTIDMPRYRRGLYKRMGDITTLITGPSGTGKELVARAIGLSRYIPFDPRSKRLKADFRTCFYGVNLSALSPTLIESELFGHAKGSFTGAIASKEGYFEVCPSHGTVFIDELGELDPTIQVKLLRVLQSRSFQRIGETEDRRFEGKIVTATNRDLAAEMATGRFRQDLFYRLNADVITTPSLREQLKDSPDQLHNLLRFITVRIVGADEADALTAGVENWIHEKMPPDYAWPGNVRELEQCVRNILVRSTYTPPDISAATSQEKHPLAPDLANQALTADEVLQHYCSYVYARTQNYQEAARILSMDRRTVKAKVDESLVALYI